ncbi:MAG: hypothetical protein RLZZ67_41 [Candidatus Parcubacteria bacterium]|jgi:hypothetical protein
MKSTLKKITALILVLLFTITSTNFILPPKQVQAQAKATACVAAYISAGLAGLAAVPQNILGVSKSSFGDSATAVLNNAGVQALSFNECVLKPLAKVMIITIIRNIGSSVVTWVNSGFEGKPSFVTDFGGTLLDAADETVGKFIEGSELGFMCNNFSFQIRIALALKYSQPFKEKARCTFTTISGNVQNFADSNGGVGWDNWLKLTTEPQNNVYGAFAVADSEVAQRMLAAVTQKKDKISIGQGFLDYETCDKFEDPQEQFEREQAGLDPAVEVLNNSTSFGAIQSSFATSSRNGAVTAPVTKGTRFVDPTGNNRTCTKKSTKTPGKIIASKLESTLGSNDIQMAVASEIDDVIAATLNQLTQKMIQGATGLLGLSKKNNTNKQSYRQKYQNQFYSETAGATSDIEDYTIENYDEAASLIESNGLVQEIYTATDSTVGTAVAANRAQQSAINNAIGVDGSSEQNLAFYKPTSQSSAGAGTSDKATNGVKDQNIGQYNNYNSSQVAATSEEQNPWWEVDLEASKQIKEIRIWRVTNKPVDKTLGTIRVVASNAGGTNVWTSGAITPNGSTANPIVVPVNESRRYVRIEKQGTLDETCRTIRSSYRYDNEYEYESCYHPLELVEVEVIGVIPRSGTGTIGTVDPIATGGGTNTGGTATVQKTLDLVVSSTNSPTLTSSVPFAYDLQVVANHSTSSLSVTHTFKKSGQRILTGNIFSSLSVTTRRGSGSSAVNSVPASSQSLTVNSISVSATEKFTFSFAGQKKPGIPTGTYIIESVLSDRFGNILQTKTTDFVVQ